MADKHMSSGTRPPLHRDPRATHPGDPAGDPAGESAPESRPVPKRTWRHARYGDAPDPPAAGVRRTTFSEEADAEATGDAKPRKP